MRKKVLLILLISFCALNFSFAQDTSDTYRITEIKIKGNRTLEKNEVLTKIRTRKGEIFDPEAAEDAERIAEMQAVGEAYYNDEQIEEGVLVFVIDEKNYIFEIQFEGNKKISDGSLKRKLSLEQGDYADSPTLDMNREIVESAYKKKGYPFVQVEIEQALLKKGILKFNIKEGARVKIDEINYKGNEGLSDNALKKISKLKKKKLLILPNYYNEENIEKAVANLQKGYYENGYLDSEVSVETEFSEEKKKARINFIIDEGPAYSIENISFAGNEYFSDERLRDLITIQQGRIFNGPSAEKDREKVRELYLEQGFINAEVTLEKNFVASDMVKIEFDIEEGDQFRIGRIDISGNQETQDKVIRRVLDEYKFKPGKIYNADIARGTGQSELEKDIRQQTLMESVLITPDGNQPGQRDAQVNVTEGKTGSVMFGAGVASDSGVIGQVVLQQRNFDITDTPESFKEFITGQAFKGAGQKMRISLMPGTEWSEYSIHFTEPYLNDRPVALDLLGSSYQRDRESYDEQRTKGMVGLEKRYSRIWRGNIGFRAESVDVEDIEAEAPDEIRELEGSNNLFGVKLGLRRDKTDDRYLPTTGDIFSTYVEQVVGDFDFTILNASYRKFWTVYEDLAGKKTVLASKVRAGNIFGTAPAFEKFYAGGQGSLRGFDYRGVSPRGVNPQTGEKDDPIGSDWIFLANSELTIPVTEEVVSLLLFVDSGAVEEGGYRVGAGAGIQIMLKRWFGPVPMRFEFASPLMKDDDDETQAFSFSVGRLF